MPDQSRIPRKLNDFVWYMKRTSDYLNEGSPPPFTGKNYARFNWTKSEFDDWSFFSEKAGKYFSAYSSPSTRTTAVKDNLKNIRRRTVQYDRKQRLLDRIASNPNVTTLRDYITFNIKRGSPLEKTTRTLRKAPIGEQVFFGMRSLGGAIVEVTCRTASASGRPHRHALANCVQAAYSTGTRFPKTPMRCEEKEIFSHAKFILRLRMNDIGKTLHLFVRWYNTRHPHLAGPWSSRKSAVIA